MGEIMFVMLIGTKKGITALGSRDLLLEFITLSLIYYDEYRGEIPDPNSLSNLDIKKYAEISLSIFNRIFGDWDEISP